MNQYQYPNQPQQSGEKPVSPVQPAENAQQPTGRRAKAVRYCKNCGEQIEPGASVCIHCKMILNPAAIRKARMIVADRNATVTTKELIRCGIFPNKGFRIAKQYAKTRPQVAAPCKKAAIIGTIAWTVLLATSIIVLLFLMGFFGAMF